MFVYRHISWLQTAVLLLAAGPAMRCLAVDPIAVLQAPDAADGFGADFGRSVAISGDWLAVGAPTDNRERERGAAYMFRRDGARWVFHQKLEGFRTDGAEFGRAVAMDGDRLVIGAPGERRAYVFTRADEGTPDDLSDDLWLVGALNTAWAVLHPLPSEFGSFGTSVDIDDDVIVIAMYPTEFYVGSAYVFRFDGTEWLPDGRLRGGDTEPGDLFASSVAVTDGMAVVGAPRDDEAGERAGSAYLFQREDDEWLQVAKLVGSDPRAFGGFGGSVAVEDDVLLVGAASGQGAAYVVRADGARWLEEAKLVAADGAPADNFGRAVATSGESAVVGAPSAAHGKDSHAGASYVFRRDDGQWKQANRLNASPSRFLGWALAVHQNYSVSGGLGTVNVHRICDGCGTLREFAALQNCIYAETAQSDLCVPLDFSRDARIDLADHGEFLTVLVGP